MAMIGGVQCLDIQLPYGIFDDPNLMVLIPTITLLLPLLRVIIDGERLPTYFFVG